MFGDMHVDDPFRGLVLAGALSSLVLTLMVGFLLGVLVA